MQQILGNPGYLQQQALGTCEYCYVSLISCKCEGQKEKRLLEKFRLIVREEIESAIKRIELI